ncbi:MAG: DNA-directed RNA polymerase subunit omega [Candidatus Zixiibacteriota bacterium]|nr:MAG: DNA-directed RNA polymerase subunit omega [candidate division Zixibacteria bacterium]
MKSLSMDELDRVTRNRYEAVIIAAQHARHLNMQRLARLEQLEQDAEVDIEARKITMVALKDLIDGKVNFDRSDTE